MKRLKKELEKGSLTVELSLLLPIVILTIALTIFIALILYQQVYITTVANSAVNRGAMLFSNPNIDIETGGLTENDLSTNVYPMLIMTTEIEEMIKDYVNTKLNEYALLPCMGREIEITYTNHFVYKKLEVTIASKYNVPSFLGLKEGLIIKAHAEARISEPEQFIRDIDFLGDKINSVRLKDEKDIQE
ncbi:MAG: hypothetical protein COA82_12040 [Alkaliphilus sp.]|nr:pilus assembly protein [bacterium AH-315-K05]MBN4074744.1 pilus assembly protein [bacterium AH-315-E09]PHS29960.1 MAG: hypothetical protein COA82_12040 [Alkaliphilus sp.]